MDITTASNGYHFTEIIELPNRTTSLFKIQDAELELLGE